MAETVSNKYTQKLQNVGVSKSRGYIEDLLETTADAQMTTFPHYCLPKIETMLKYIRTVEKPKKVEAIKSMQIRFEIGKTKIN